MELAIIIILTLSLGALLFSRIHFHFSFNLTISRDSKFNSRLKTPPTGSREAKRREKPRPPAVRSIRDSSVTSAIEAARRSAEADLSSALINLGCRKERADMVA